MIDPVATTPAPPDAKPSVFLSPFAQVFLCALLGTTAEVLLKVGATHFSPGPAALAWLEPTGLTTGWVWLSILFTILSLFAWMAAIRTLPLSIAFTLSNMVHVLIPLSCWAFLHESISPRRWCGIALVIMGLLIIAKPFARLDARL